jgi:3-deoxy-7-phosphoheptulonate synthase
VVYEDKQGVKDALEKLQKLPPLVTTQEVRTIFWSLVNDSTTDMNQDQQSQG